MRKDTTTLTFYFKGGNVVSADSVIKWEMGFRSGKISEITITQSKEKGTTAIIVNTIDMDSIDCVTETFK